MGGFYNAKRTRNLFEPNKPFRLSRSKIDLFLKCPRCFYLDRKLGLARPPSFPFTLNSAVDKLLKKELDVYRAKRQPHPLMLQYGVDAVPFSHPSLEEWREALSGGITYNDPRSGFTITGGIDDVWVNPAGELIIVDYKATAKAGEVTLDADWQDSYKRQMEIYQWLFRKNGFPVSKTGYFLYCNGKTDLAGLDGKLEFDLKLIPYVGDDSWVEEAVLEAYDCLMRESLPDPGADCEFCQYRLRAQEIENRKSQDTGHPSQANAP